MKVTEVIKMSEYCEPFLASVNELEPCQTYLATQIVHGACHLEREYFLCVYVCMYMYVYVLLHGVRDKEHTVLCD